MTSFVRRRPLALWVGVVCLLSSFRASKALSSAALARTAFHWMRQLRERCSRMLCFLSLSSRPHATALFGVSDVRVKPMSRQVLEPSWVVLSCVACCANAGVTTAGLSTRWKTTFRERLSASAMISNSLISSSSTTGSTSSTMTSSNSTTGSTSSTTGSSSTKARLRKKGQSRRRSRTQTRSASGERPSRSGGQTRRSGGLKRRR